MRRECWTGSSTHPRPMSGRLLSISSSLVVFLQGLVFPLGTPAHHTVLQRARFILPLQRCHGRRVDPRILSCEQQDIRTDEGPARRDVNGERDACRCVLCTLEDVPI